MDNEMKLREIVSRASGRDAFAIGLDDDLTEVVALDSIASLDVLAAVELHFDVLLPEDRIEELLTLRQILAAIEEDELCALD